MSTAKRQLVKIVSEICAEHKIEFKSFSYDWILELSANGRKLFIYGYKFSNNDAAIERICDDKSALSDILSAHGIAHVEHYFFMSPNNRQYTGENGDWERMKALLDKYGKIVCKANAGSGGKNVYKAGNQKELEIAVHSVFTKSKSMCIAPYRKIKSEYRVILVNASIGVIYEKKRPFVVGNGIDSIKQLICRDSTLSDIEVDEEIDLDSVPAENQAVEIAWKHNLGQGATPIILEDPVLRGKLSSIAHVCALALNIKFASIDIIDSDKGLEVLEINSGVMMENLANSSPENYMVAKRIYEQAILDYLGMNDPKYAYLAKRPRKSRFVLPVLEEIAHEKNIEIIPDRQEGNFAAFIFKNGKRFIAKDYPFNINTAGSISLCTNKAACACFLSEMNFRTPKQKYFVKKSDIRVTLAELKKHLKNPNRSLGFGYPMIMKPNSLSQGVGVFKVTTPEEGETAAKRIMALKDNLFLLQEYCSGRDYRIVVLGNTILQAYERIPFQIIGNGRNTIEELLADKLELFKREKRDKMVDISDPRIIESIVNQRYNLKTILDDGTVCRLQDVANLSLGGTTEDKLQSISPYYAQLAIKIAACLNLKLCGIDLIADDITNPGNTDYVVLEVNSAPGLDNYLFSGKQQEEYVKCLYSKVLDYLETL